MLITLMTVSKVRFTQIVTIKISRIVKKVIIYLVLEKKQINYNRIYN
jgi:hypothetical protein